MLCTCIRQTQCISIRCTTCIRTVLNSSIYCETCSLAKLVKKKCTISYALDSESKQLNGFYHNSWTLKHFVKREICARGKTSFHSLECRWKLFVVRMIGNSISPSRIIWKELSSSDTICYGQNATKQHNKIALMTMTRERVTQCIFNDQKRNEHFSWGHQRQVSTQHFIDVEPSEWMVTAVKSEMQMVISFH